MNILGVDPGKTTGAVLLEYDPKTCAVIRSIIMDEIKEDHYLKWVNSWNEPGSPWQVNSVVCEDFILRPKQYQGKARIEFENQWTELPVAKQIGVVELRCYQLGVRLYMQQPSIKPVGYANAGMKYVKGSKSEGVHLRDATAHIYYLIKNGVK